MRHCKIRLTRDEARRAIAAGLRSDAQYARHLIQSAAKFYNEKPDADSQNALYAAYYFLKRHFAQSAGRARELGLSNLAECFEVFRGMPEDCLVEESLGMANPRIPHAEMIATLIEKLREAVEMCHLAAFAIDMGSGIIYDDETDVISAISDVTGIPMGKIGTSTRIEDLKLSDKQLAEISRILGDNYGYDQNFLLYTSPETVNDIVDIVSLDKENDA